MEQVILGIMIGLAGLFVVWLALKFVASFLYICKPNEVIVFSGRSHTLADGTKVGFSVLEHGRRIRIPFLETATRMDVSTMTVHISIQNAYSRGNIPLSVSAIANVKISTQPGVIDNATERFLGRDREEVRRVAKETIEGALRGAVAKLTPEQVNEDRARIVEALSEEAEEDLKKIGIQIDTLNIQSVTDEVNYLDSIGRAKIAAVLRDAEVAESDNEREAERAIADADARGRVAQENAQAKILAKENELRRIVAELEGQARSEEERTTASADEVRARAEIKLQEVRSELERLRLRADEVLPADARRVAAELEAAGHAAIIAAEGRASADALRMMGEAWHRAGTHAEDIFLIQQLEPLVRDVVEKVGSIDIQHVHLVDKGDGESIGRLASAYPRTVAAVLDSIADTSGIPIRDLLRRTLPFQAGDNPPRIATTPPAREQDEGATRSESRRPATSSAFTGAHIAASSARSTRPTSTTGPNEPTAEQDAVPSPLDASRSASAAAAQVSATSAEASDASSSGEQA